MKLKVGCEVETSYGPGKLFAFEPVWTIVKLNRSGLKLRFALEQIIHRTQCPCVPTPKEDLSPRELSPKTIAFSESIAFDQPQIQLAQDGLSQDSPFRHERFLIEALRYGLVPGGRCREITVGIEPLTKWVHANLPESKEPRVAQIVGAFGTGKSHMMSLVRECAQAKNFVTANVEVDGHNISLGNPAKLYYKLCTTLQSPDGERLTPMDLIRKCLKSKNIPPIVREGHYGGCYNVIALAALLASRAKLDEFEPILDDHLVCGQNLTGPQIKKEIRLALGGALGTFNLKPVISASITLKNLDLVATLAFLASACEASGYSGLVLTIDEFEVEHTGSRINFGKTCSLLSEIGHFMRCAQSHKISGHTPAWKPTPLGIFFAATGETGHRGDAAVDALIDEAKGRNFHLAPLSMDEYVELGQKIRDYYDRAYSTSTKLTVEKLRKRAKQLLSTGDSGITRQFIKGVVAQLDSEHGPGLYR